MPYFKKKNFILIICIIVSLFQFRKCDWPSERTRVHVTHTSFSTCGSRKKRTCHCISYINIGYRLIRTFISAFISGTADIKCADITVLNISILVSLYRQIFFKTDAFHFPKMKMHNWKLVLVLLYENQFVIMKYQIMTIKNFLYKRILLPVWAADTNE